MAVPFTLLGINPKLAGDTVMFISATVGYLGTSALAFVSIVLLWRIRSTRRLLPVAGTVVLACYAGLHHELVALMMLGALCGLALTMPRHEWSRRAVVGAVVVSAVSVARFSAGGLWRRNETLRPPFQHDPDLGLLGQLRLYPIHALSQQVGSFPAIYVVGVAAIVLVAVIAHVHGRRMRWLLSVFVLAVLATGWLAARVRLLGQRGGPARLEDVYRSTTASVLLAATVVVLVSATVIVWQARTVPGGQLLAMIFGATLGTFVMILALGNSGSRTSYLPQLFILVFAAAAIHIAWLSSNQRSSSAMHTWTLLLAAATFGPALIGATNLVTNVDRNIAAWQPSLAQIRQAQQGKRQVVTIPKQLPAPDYSADYLAPRMGSRLKYFYDLPDDVRIVLK